MKLLANLLLVVGVILLVLAAMGRLTGDPYRVVSFKVITLIIFANTSILLAVAVKLFEKK